MAPVINTRGPLYVYPGGIVKRTTYHVMNLYANKLQPNVLPFSIKSDSLTNGRISVPVVDGILTCSDDKKVLSIALVNKDPKNEAECNLGLEKIDGAVNAIILSGDSPDAYNDVDKPNRVMPESKQVTIKDGKVTIPAHSLMILNINRR